MRAKVEDLLGKTLESVVINNDRDVIDFVTTTGQRYRMEHYQDCCETVAIEDIAGEINDLVGAPILQAEVATQDGLQDKLVSSTWTFYKLGTIKGTVTIRWLGTSNGYYSEEVDFSLVKP